MITNIDSRKEQQWYERVTLYITGMVDFLVDHLNTTAGNVLIKASPILAPAPSAIFVYAALRAAGFDPWACLIVTGVVEGLGFAAVYARHRIESINRTLPPDQQKDTAIARRMIVMYIAVTLAVLFAFEAVPAWSTRDFVYATVHTAPLIFPFFSLLGANVYSLLDWIQRTEHNVEAVRSAEWESKEKELRVLIEKLRADLADSQQRATDAIARNESQAQQIERLRDWVHDEQLQRTKAEAQLTATEKSIDRGIAQPVERNSRKRKRKPQLQPAELNDAQIEILRVIKAQPAIEQKAIAEELGKSPSAISRQVRPMRDSQLLEMLDGEWVIHPDAIVQLNGQLHGAHG